MFDFDFYWQLRTVCRAFYALAEEVACKQAQKVAAAFVAHYNDVNGLCKVLAHLKNPGPTTWPSEVSALGSLAKLGTLLSAYYVFGASYGIAFKIDNDTHFFVARPFYVVMCPPSRVALIRADGIVRLFRHYPLTHVFTFRAYEVLEQFGLRRWRFTGRTARERECKRLGAWPLPANATMDWDDFFRDLRGRAQS